MEPASSSSSSDDKSISSTNSSNNSSSNAESDDGGEEEQLKMMLQRKSNSKSSSSKNKSIEKEDSDDGNDSDNSDEDENGVSSSVPKSMDELPSDDSCLDDDSDDENDNDSSSGSEDNESDNDDPPTSKTQNSYLRDGDDVEEEIMTLEERLYKQQQEGRWSNDNHNGQDQDTKIAFKANVRDKKKRALELAQERLLAFKSKKQKMSENHKNDNKNYSDTDDSDSDSDDDDSTQQPPKLEQEEKEDEVKKPRKKKNKNKPTEASSLRSAYYARGAPNLNSSGIGIEIGANRYKPRDPRMDSLSGYYDQNVFDKRFGFIDDMRGEEIERLKQRCTAWKTTGKKGRQLRKKLGLTSSETTREQDEIELGRLIQENATKKEEQRKRNAKTIVKKKIRDDVASGKRGVYYLKKRDMKKMELEAKFEELKKRGGDAAVNKALAKRRKKMMSKDSSIMPKNF